MRHEITSLNTKKSLAASLKKLMAEKPFSKITVSEIITDCDVNRKTFYYHFEDIYALLKWMLEQEAIEVVKQFDFMLEYEDAIRFVMDYVDENKHILNCAFDAIGREQMKHFFYQDFIGVCRIIIEGAEKDTGVTIDEDYRQFICNFYTEALAGMLIDWFRDRNQRDRQKTIDYISRIFHGSLPNILVSGEMAE